MNLILLELDLILRALLTSAFTSVTGPNRDAVKQYNFVPPIQNQVWHRR